MMRTLLLATILSAAKQVTSSAKVANSATFKRWCPCYQIIILFINSVLNRVFVAREKWNPGVRDVSAKEVPQKQEQIVLERSARLNLDPGRCD